MVLFGMVGCVYEPNICPTLAERQSVCDRKMVLLACYRPVESI